MSEMIRKDAFFRLAHVHASEEARIVARMIERGHLLRSEDHAGWPLDEAYAVLIEMRDEAAATPWRFRPRQLSGW